MKFMQLPAVPIILLLLTSCSGTSNHTIPKQLKLDNWLIDSLTTEGYDYSILEKPMHGLSDTLIRGYTDRINGVFHNTKWNPKTLSISGLHFEKNEDLTINIVHYYRFNFKDSSEEKKFSKFKNNILNYQQNHKNQVQFFTKNGEHYLKLIPMP